MNCMKASDLYEIKIQPTNDEERYILEEARQHLDETIFSSKWDPDNVHVKNVIALGKKNVPFLIEFLRENNHPQGMYSHFLIDVLFELYRDDLKIEGYLGIDGCIKTLLALYDNSMLEYN